MFLKQPRISREAQHRLTLNLLLIFFLIFRTWIVVIHFLFFSSFLFPSKKFWTFFSIFSTKQTIQKRKKSEWKNVRKKKQELRKKKILDRGFHRYPRREIFLVSFCTQNLFSKKKKWWRREEEEYDHTFILDQYISGSGDTCYSGHGESGNFVKTEW